MERRPKKEGVWKVHLPGNWLEDLCEKENGESVKGKAGQGRSDAVGNLASGEQPVGETIQLGKTFFLLSRSRK